MAPAIYYPLSLHLQQVYKSLVYKPSDFLESQKVQGEVPSPPVHSELGDDKIEEITRAIESYDK
jgi:dTDP-4-amino-4,6-dideoxygalactose transaminase